MSWNISRKRDVTRETKLWFGKYEGERIADVIDSDPSYLKWCLENLEQFAEAVDIGLAEEIDEAVVAERGDRYVDDRGRSW